MSNSNEIYGSFVCNLVTSLKATTMYETNGMILHHKEALASLIEDTLIPKSKNLMELKSNDVAVSNSKHILEIQENFDDTEFIWGVKQSGNKYKSVTIKNEIYALNDCVFCRSGLELEYIGKIMKLFQEDNKKSCTLRWFFRPFELPTSLKETYKVANTQELFLAFGEGTGVENKNCLVSNISSIRSFYNVENVVSLEVITGKCKVLCTAKDDFNELPSNDHLSMCDFFFDKAFDCDTLQIVGLDAVVDAIGAQNVYNKKEWTNWKKNDLHAIPLVSSPKKTICQSFDSHALPTNSSNGYMLPLTKCFSSPTISEQSTKITEKRKRDLLENYGPSQKVMGNFKKTKLSPTLKNSKLFDIVSLAKKEEQDNKCGSEVKSNITLVDASTIDKLSSKPNFHKNPKLDSIERLENHNLDGCVQNCSIVSNDIPMILEQNTEEVGNNADDICVTYEGFPKESLVRPLEKSESSTSKLQKDESSSDHTPQEHSNKEPLNLKINTTPLARNKTAPSKVVQNKRAKQTLNVTIDIAFQILTKKKSFKSNASRIPKGKKGLIEKNQDQISNTLHCDEFQKIHEDIKERHQLACSKDQQSFTSPLTTTMPTSIVGENSKIKEILESLPSSEIDWHDKIEKAVTSKRILLLDNVDPKLHSTELQEMLSNYLETKCQVQKIMPNSFYYSTISALVKLPTPEVAQRSLQSLCTDCLIVGERILVASLYEGLDFAKEIYCFRGHICVQPTCEMLKKDFIEMNIMPHVAQGNTVEFTFGLRWRLLQEQHELQWQLLNELLQKGFHLPNKETKTNKQAKNQKNENVRSLVA